MPESWFDIDVLWLDLVANADKSETGRPGDSGMGFWNEEELRTERLVSFC